MTCIVDVNGDYRVPTDWIKLRTCSLDILEDAHQEGFKRVKLPCAGTWVKRGGGHIFEGGVLAGHYGTYLNYNTQDNSEEVDHCIRHESLLPFFQWMVIKSYCN